MINLFCIPDFLSVGRWYGLGPNLTKGDDESHNLFVLPPKANDKCCVRTHPRLQSTPSSLWPVEISWEASPIRE